MNTDKVMTESFRAMSILAQSSQRNFPELTYLLKSIQAWFDRRLRDSRAGKRPVDACLPAAKNVFNNRLRSVLEVLDSAAT